MGFRESIPLGDFIQSSPFLAENLRAPGLMSPPVQDQILYQDPAQAGEGVRTCSTSMELECWPSVVWDVNGYYRELGVGWAATRKQMLRSYLMRGGQDDERLTYILSQLLDPEVRRAYDACPLGESFFDEYVAAEIRKQALRVARRLSVSADKALSILGYEIRDDDPESDSDVDIPQEDGENGVTSEASSEAPEVWPYTYYLWRMRKREMRLATVEVMRRWQEAIIAECGARGVSINFGVGIMGGGRASRVLTLSVRDARVAFVSVNHIADIEVLAPSAVDRLISSQGR